MTESNRLCRGDLEEPLQLRSYLNLTISSEDEDFTETLSKQYHSLSLVSREAQRNDWRDELGRTEKEIEDLRTQLLAKVRHANMLKTRLGITAWREFSTDIKVGLKKVQESGVYLKVGETFSDIGESIEEFKKTIQKDTMYQKTVLELEKAKEKAATVKEKATTELLVAKEKTASELLLAKEKATSELQMVQKKTSESLGSVQKKASAIVRTQDIREYRAEERTDTGE
ncbi:uncharacterized protein LOC111706285 [Eurytemora carolleeae]|uniref:uncharacterized protein LOC111706285 n=1 Tax=Eurytemora carolleeae TaxID=1294199 RepID=UPI000C77A775|nr:uncharacterized protein LOC111706285 [Eurytemora carolleeae]|eukprot:XP_023334888.1 uncharacterized protein LOC111706285 [Eurytemora affinis]